MTTDAPLATPRLPGKDEQPMSNAFLDANAPDTAHGILSEIMDVVILEEHCTVAEALDAIKDALGWHELVKACELSLAEFERMKNSSEPFFGAPTRAMDATEAALAKAKENAP